MQKLLLLLSTMALLFLGERATVEQPTVTKIPGAPPATSPTIAEEVTNAPRSLKQKVTIARSNNETQQGRSFLADRNNAPAR